MSHKQVHNVFVTLMLIYMSLGVLHAQFKFDYSDSISVYRGAKKLDLAWAGGLNYSQFSSIDFDFDGDEDLFVFDRSNNNIRLFEQVVLNGKKTYRLVHNSAQFFPPDLYYRVALVDYDQDGKVDLFGHANSGVMVYKNTGSAATGLTWELKSNLLYSTNNLGERNHLYISSNDIPAYVDVEGDGDLDVLTYHIGGERIEYHQNQSMDLYNVPDSLIFVLKNECWGRFKEDANSSQILLDDQTSPCIGSVISNPQSPKEGVDALGKELESKDLTRHTGSTLLAIDLDDSGVLDLLIGDVSSRRVFALWNAGTEPNTNSVMNKIDVTYPTSDTPVDLANFPASFYLDVDHDGVKDLLVSANARNASENRKSIWYYKNNGTNTKPNFSFQTSAFFQEDMIDVGSGSIPVFVDQNGDGLLDLLLSNFYRYKEVNDWESTLSVYRNTGSVNKASLTWITDDYFNYTNLGLGLRSVPTFGDQDGDGDLDLILGLENGTLSYFENTAGPNQTFAFASPIHQMTDGLGQTIQVASYAFPQLFDLNNDGLLDLIIGVKTGELYYYENTGSLQAPVYTERNTKLGEIDLSPTNTAAYAAPHFFRHADTTYLLLGSSKGTLRFYAGIDSNLDPGEVFQLIDTNFRGIKVEANSSCWVTDMDQDGNLDLFVGGDLGGLFHLEHDELSTLTLAHKSNKELFRLFPNPANNTLNLQHAANPEDYGYRLVSMTGQLVGSAERLPLTIDLSPIPDGVYLIYFIPKSGADQVEVHRLTKLSGH